MVHQFDTVDVLPKEMRHDPLPLRTSNNLLSFDFIALNRVVLVDERVHAVQLRIEKIHGGIYKKRLTFLEQIAAGIPRFITI